MGLTFTQLVALGADSGSDFVIDFGNGDVLTVENRTEASMTAGDFIFA